MKAGYNVIRNKNEFQFFTSLGAAYSVKFTLADEYFNNTKIQGKLYRLDIELLNPGPINTYDFLISLTIADIIVDFFSEDETRLIFYICDPANGRLKARLRKFNHWFLMLNNGSFNKIDALVSAKEIELHLTFIFRCNNTLAYDITEFINNAKDNLSNK